MPSMVKSFSFDPREYPELARWLENLSQERGRVAHEVTQILNAYVTGKPRPLLDQRVLPVEVLQRIEGRLERIEARLQNGTIAPAAEADPDPTAGLPEDVLANLDKLAL